MRISDWSSDVCSSDLADDGGIFAQAVDMRDRKVRRREAGEYARLAFDRMRPGQEGTGRLAPQDIGRGPRGHAEGRVRLPALELADRKRPLKACDMFAHPDRKSTRLNSSH